MPTTTRIAGTLQGEEGGLLTVSAGRAAAVLGAGPAVVTLRRKFRAKQWRTERRVKRGQGCVGADRALQLTSPSPAKGHELTQLPLPGGPGAGDGGGRRWRPSSRPRPSSCAAPTTKSAGTSKARRIGAAALALLCFRDEAAVASVQSAARRPPCCGRGVPSGKGGRAARQIESRGRGGQS